MPYIPFTEEQKLQASEVDLVEFLRRQGEELIRSGPEYWLASDHSVTVRGNGWYDHAVKQGGGKDSASRSLQMMERPLMTPDELKSISKGQFVVMKTGTHPAPTALPKTSPAKSGASYAQARRIRREPPAPCDCTHR